MQIFFAHMEMAYDEKNQAKIDQYAALFIEQVKKLHHTKEETEALACYAQNDRNKDNKKRGRAYFCKIEWN